VSSATGAEAPLLEPDAWRDVAGYLEGFREGGSPIWSSIHPSDEMYAYELSMPYRTREAAAIGYFATGHQIFRTMREIVEWRFGGFGGVRAFLDFASGYGRSTRFLVRALDPNRITAAEIDPAAVRFQQEAFGVRGLVSSAEPEGLRLETYYDVIFASSFFSHLPQSSFEPWLRRLRSGLAPGGLLIFSVHGMRLLPEEEADAAAGIVFRAVSETDRLDSRQYGTSFVTDAFVRAAAGRAGQADDRLLEFPRGLGGYQDLFVLAASPQTPGPELRVSRYPLGACDRADVGDGGVRMEGWAEGDRGERPPDVRLFVGNDVAAHSPGAPGGAAGSRRPWSFRVPLSAVDPDVVVRVEAESERGLARILVIGTTRPYLPAPPL
jgi:SAM-dependent methyltransferase